MRRNYILYIAIALVNIWIIIVLLSVSSGFSSYLPILSVVGCSCLFILAAPIIVHNWRLGLITGLICCLLILPYNIMLAVEIIKDSVVNWGFMLAVGPPLLTLTGLYFSLSDLLKRQKGRDVQGKLAKLFLTVIPIFLFCLYVLLHGYYWSFEVVK